MTSKITLKSAGPFLLLTFIYFIVGFLTTVNGQCQGPLKIAFLSEVTDTKNSLATLISFAFFLGYLLNSSKTGRMLDKIGYKKTLVRSMVVMVFGLAFYLASALIAEYWGGKGMHIGSDFVPFGYFVFLFGSYLMGTSAAMLQVVINPYIAAFYDFLVIVKSMSGMADSFSSLGASFGFHATMKRTLAFVTL